MSKVNESFPQISRPGEYVALLTFKAQTREGEAYIFMACDGFSEFGFHLCAELDESPASIIKAVYLLTENKDFVRHMHQGFTLVLDRYESLSERIEAVIKPVGGILMFNKPFHKKIAAPLVTGFSQFKK